MHLEAQRSTSQKPTAQPNVETQRSACSVSYKIPPAANSEITAKKNLTASTAQKAGII